MSKTDESFICFCHKSFTYNQMKSSHFKECQDFKDQFKDIDETIEKSIRHFLDKIKRLHEDSNNKNERKKYDQNGLKLLKFFLKRYVNLIGNLINANNNDIKNTRSVKIRSESNFNKKDLNVEKQISAKQQHLIIKKDLLDLVESKSHKNIRENISEKDIVFEYCKEVYNTNPDFDETLLNMISYSISSLTSKECILIVTNNDNERNNPVKISDTEDYILYDFPISDTKFYVILY